MPEAVQLQKAQLVEVKLGTPDDPGTTEVDGGQRVDVQFNPESLKVTYSNNFGGGDQSGGSAMQFVSKSSTKLAVELLFDTTVPGEHTDVRKHTEEVNHFMQPKEVAGDAQGRMAPPGVRFHWGTFLFDGVMTSLDETLDLFSAEGVPLRSKANLSITSQEIQFRFSEASSVGGGPGAAGTTPTEPARPRDSVQEMAGRLGQPDIWRSIAEANDIENPRFPPVGDRLGTITRGIVS